jgi:hypothetical protein
MPAASAVLRCAASTPSKNRSPPPAGRSYVPTRPSCHPTIAPARCREMRCPAPDGAHAASDAKRWGLTSSPRATSANDTPASSRPTAASLNSLVNCLRDNPMTQFSIHWILSLNQLCQKWGQVQTGTMLAFGKIWREIFPGEEAIFCGADSSGAEAGSIGCAFGGADPSCAHDC